MEFKYQKYEHLVLRNGFSGPEHRLDEHKATVARHASALMCKSLAVAARKDRDVGQVQPCEKAMQAVREMQADGVQVQPEHATALLPSLLHKADPENPSPYLLEVVKLLLDAGADVNSRHDAGKPAIFHCKTDELRKLVIDAGADLNAENDRGRTPLSFAETAETAKLLIESGADVNHCDKQGRTPLHSCTHQDAVIAIVDAGGDINARDDLGRTPLHCAAQSGIANSATSALIDAGSNIEARDNENNTPLHLVGNTPSLYALLSHADVDAVNNKGQKPDESTSYKQAKSLIKHERLARQEARSKAAGASIEAAFAQPSPDAVKSLRDDIKALAERAAGQAATPRKGRGLEL